MIKVLSSLLVVILLAAAARGQDTKAPNGGNSLSSPNSGLTQASKSGSDSTFAQRFPRYRLRPGDVFDLVFEFTPEYNQTVTIQPDGYISLRGTGDLYIAGRTVTELTAAVRNAYSKILHEPLISIILKDFEKPYFVAGGEVDHPGKYELRGDTTVVQAIAVAGGFKDSAKHSQVVLFRRVSDDWMEAKILDVKKMEAKRDLSEDMHLRPGDMVFVPKNRLSKIARFLPTSNMSLFPGTF